MRIDAVTASAAGSMRSPWNGVCDTVRGAEPQLAARAISTHHAQLEEASEFALTASLHVPPRAEAAEAAGDARVSSGMLTRPPSPADRCRRRREGTIRRREGIAGGRSLGARGDPAGVAWAP